jgi:hypothetical protein
MHHKKTHGKFNSLKQISFNELYTCPICLCVAHLVSFKSNIFIISTNLLLINSPYWKFIWRSMSMFEHQSLLDSFKWINFIHVLDHASIHFIQIDEWHSSRWRLLSMNTFIHVQVNAPSLGFRLMHKQSSMKKEGNSLHVTFGQKGRQMTCQ